jgi:hypothetical protein
MCLCQKGKPSVKGSGGFKEIYQALIAVVVLF